MYFLLYNCDVLFFVKFYKFFKVLFYSKIIILFFLIDSGFCCGLIFFVIFKDIVVVVGNKVVFECIVNGFFKLRVIWLWDKLFVVFGSDYFFLGESNFLIELVFVVYVGIYICCVLVGVRV